MMQQASAAVRDRTARRKNRTRRQLMEAAIGLVLEKGYEDVMTDDITERADVGRRTFYNHFVNKRDCVLAAVTDRFTRYAENEDRDLDAATDRDEALALAIMASRIFRDIAEDPITGRLALYPRLLHEAIADSQRDFLIADMARGIVAGRLRPTLSTDALEPIVGWGFVGLVTASIKRNSQKEDSLAWAGFILHNLGIEQAQASELITGINAHGQED